MTSRNLHDKNGKTIVPWLTIAIVIALLDQISKLWISSILHYGQTITLTPFFNLRLVYNEGAAFSFLASQSGWQRYLFTVISILAIIGLVYLLKRHAHKKPNAVQKAPQAQFLFGV